MFSFAELKIDAAIWQVREIKLEPGYMVFFYTDKKRIELLARKSKGQLRVADDRSAYLPLPRQDLPPDELILLAQAMLRSK
jgi:transcription-repair coupling factor (superfamily II helicase)